MDWVKIFHSLVIPFLGGFTLTLGKLIADRKLLSFNESSDIALDMVLLAVGALGAFYIQRHSIEATIDAGVVDAFLAAALLYIRHRRRLTTISGVALAPITPIQGLCQLVLGFSSIVWTILAF